MIIAERNYRHRCSKTERETIVSDLNIAVHKLLFVNGNKRTTTFIDKSLSLHNIVVFVWRPSILYLDKLGMDRRTNSLIEMLVVFN